MFTTTRISFTPVRQKRTVKTRCIRCKKKLTRVLSTTYYRNGMHDESKTRAENDRWLDSEAKKLARKGTICASCRAEEA